MRKVGLAAFMLVILLTPSFANAQTSQITLLDTFGEFERGEEIFVFGQVSQVVPELFVVIQIINPGGDLCQVQQLKPLADGHFITEPTPLLGRICGIAGDYTVKVFYGDFLNTGSFVLTGQTAQTSSDVEYLVLATDVVESKIRSKTLTDAQSSEFTSKLDQIRQMSASGSAIMQLRDLYSNILLASFDDSDLFDVPAKFRPSIEAAGDMVEKQVNSSILDQAGARTINSQIHNAMFYAQIGDEKNAISTINDVYVQITNVDPQKVTSEQPPTYEELNSLLLNMMTKSGSIMSRQLKEEVGFIFARGTGPIYSDELGGLLDMLTKANTLDTTLRQSDNLTLIVRTEWGTLRESLIQKETLEEFLKQKEKVDKLFEATILLRNLDRVDRFISRDPQPDLAVLIEPKIDDLVTQLRLATSPDDVIAAEQEIVDLKNVIDISARISTTIEFSRQNNADPQLITSFESLLDRVEGTSTLAEVLEIVTEFDSAINDLREKRSPLSVLKFEYEKMRSQAEIQGDYESLVKINNALKAINTATELEKGNTLVSRMDKLEVLLSWASQQQPIIKTKLDSYTKDAYKIRAADILQRAQSLENLANLGITNNRFLPGYVDFTDSLKERLSVARNLVIRGDLDGADGMVRQLFAEWQQVSQKYDEDPLGSPIGYTVDEIKRIEYRQKAESLSKFATEFYNADFAERTDEFNRLMEKTYDLIEYGNFVDADITINQIRTLLSESMELSNRKIMFDISYEPQKQVWVMSGAVDKQIMDRRENLYLTVYDMDGNTHSTLKFSDTKHGEFFTQWRAPSEPGLYVVMLQYQNNKASQIVNVPDREVPTFSNSDLRNVDYARNYEELKTFVNAFGASNYGANRQLFDTVMKETESALNKKDFSTSQSKINELQSMIERYLPSRSKSAVIDAYVDGNKLYVSGALYKTVAFSEDIYVDIFDQRGNRVDEISLKDSSSGYFNKMLNVNYEKGMYVAQLQYHDVLVSDFFRIP